MTGGRKLLSALLALLLGVQWATAAAHCLRFAPVFPETICAAARIDHAAGDDEGQAPADRHQAMSFCAACALPAAATVPPSVAVPGVGTWEPAGWGALPDLAAPPVTWPLVHRARAPPAA